MDDLFGEVISSYSRAQAIEDGFLVDLTQGDFEQITKEHFKVHVACTIDVFSDLKSVVDSGNGNWNGILHDIYSMSKTPLAKKYRVGPGEEIHFKVRFGGKNHDFKLHCGPGDNREMVLTLMLPHED